MTIGRNDTVTVVSSGVIVVGNIVAGSDGCISVVRGDGSGAGVIVVIIIKRSRVSNDDISVIIVGSIGIGTVDANGSDDGIIVVRGSRG